jgi:hypothetical protein
MVVNDESQKGIWLVSLSSLLHMEKHVYVVVRLIHGDLAVRPRFVTLACCVTVTTCYPSAYSLLRSMECIERRLKPISTSQQ